MRKIHRKNFIREKQSSKTDPELISMVSRELKISYDDADNKIKTIVECIRQCVTLNGTVNIRRLGRLHIKQTRRARRKNFKGTIIEIPIIYSLKFHTSDSLRSLVNKKLKRDTDDKIAGRK